MARDSEIEKLVHLYQDGAFNRRELIRRVARRTGNVATAVAALEVLGVTPEPAAAQSCPATVPEAAPDIDARMVEYPGEAGTVFGYLARPRDPAFPTRSRARGVPDLPAVLVIHENRGLNDHIKDVTRRVARAGFVGLGVDLISRLGGTHQFPDPVQAGQAYNRVGNAAYLQDMLSSLAYLKNLRGVLPDRLGAVGFCAGGGNCFNLAVNSPDLSAAAVFYGTPPALELLDGLRAALLGVYAEQDRNTNSRVPALLTALMDRRKTFGLHIYEGVGHAFHNDTGPAYNPVAACDAWARTLAFFDLHLRPGLR